MSNYFLTPDHITAYAEVLGGPGLCPALLRMSPHGGGFHQGMGVTGTECWVLIYIIYEQHYLTFIEIIRIQLIITQ